MIRRWSILLFYAPAQLSSSPSSPPVFHHFSYIIYFCQWTKHINNHRHGSPVESFRGVQTHTSFCGPGQFLPGVQDLTETSPLTVLHDNEELRSGSYRQSQGHITSLSLERWIVPDTLMILVLQFTHPPLGHKCQTFAGCWVTQTASRFQFPYRKQT